MNVDHVLSQDGNVVVLDAKKNKIAIGNVDCDKGGLIKVGHQEGVDEYEYVPEAEQTGFIKVGTINSDQCKKLVISSGTY